MNFLCVAGEWDACPQTAAKRDMRAMGLPCRWGELADFRSDSAPDCAPSTCSCGTRASRSNSPRSRRRLSRNLPPIRSSASASPSTKHHKTKQERPVVRRDFESQHLDKGYPAPSPNQTHRAYRRDRAGSARPYVHLRIAFRLSTGRLSRNLPPIRSSGSAFSSARYPEQKEGAPRCGDAPLGCISQAAGDS